MMADNEGEQTTDPPAEDEVDNHNKDNKNEEGVTERQENTVETKKDNDDEEIVKEPKNPAKSFSQDKNNDKVDVLFKAAGDAPIMKKRKWKVDRQKTVAYLIDFIKKFIKCDASDSLFLYVNQTFVPAPDQVISNLYECYGSDGKLVLHYCKTQAWG